MFEGEKTRKSIFKEIFSSQSDYYIASLKKKHTQKKQRNSNNNNKISCHVEQKYGVKTVKGSEKGKRSEFKIKCN